MVVSSTVVMLKDANTVMLTTLTMTIKPLPLLLGHGGISNVIHG